MQQQQLHGGRKASHNRNLFFAIFLVILGVALIRNFHTASHPMVLIGALHLSDVDAATFSGFKEGMRELGYLEGENIRYLYLGAAGKIDMLDALVTKLVDAHVDLIFVSSTPATLAVKRITSQDPIPAVFAPVNDPVAAGIVASIRAPGGNLTGVRLPSGDALRLQWLRRVVPEANRVLFPYSPADESAVESLRQTERAAETLGIQLLPRPVNDVQAVRDDLERWARDARADAIFLPRDSLVESRIAAIVEVAAVLRLPLCAPSLTQVEAGALLSYGFVHREIGFQAARLAAQILGGVPPADLPVETAESYLSLNLKTARALGIRPPRDLLRQAQTLIH